MTTTATKAQDYFQCPNCDYICTKADLYNTEWRMLMCPSCQEDFGDGTGWSNPPITGRGETEDGTYYENAMTMEEIQSQLEWQQEIREKGPIQAMIEKFLRKPEEGEEDICRQ